MIGVINSGRNLLVYSVYSVIFRETENKCKLLLFQPLSRNRGQKRKVASWMQLDQDSSQLWIERVAVDVERRHYRYICCLFESFTVYLGGGLFL